MPNLTARGNTEMTNYINQRGGLVRQMWAHRDENLVVLYRICSQPELFETWMYCLAGGKYRDLTAMAPTEEAAVQQVANNEGMPGARGRVDNRYAMLAKLKSQGASVSLKAPTREVVEYSHRPATQFTGGLLKVWINKAYTVLGSGLEFEGGGGVVVQIGTPLSAVETDQSNVDSTPRSI